MTLNCHIMKTENEYRGGIYSYLLKTWKVFTKYDFFSFLDDEQISFYVPSKFLSISILITPNVYLIICFG